MDKRFLSIKEAAQLSSLSSRYLYDLCQKRQIRFFKIGKRILLDQQDLENFIQQEAVELVDNWSEKLGIKK